jgi:hypothetical protein
MFHFGPDTGLELFGLIQQTSPRRLLIQCPAFTWAYGNLPVHIGGLRAFLNSLVSAITKGNAFLTVQQIAGLGIKPTNSVQGTTRFISSMNTRLRVRLVTSSNPVAPRLICFIDIQRFSGLSGWLSFADDPEVIVCSLFRTSLRTGCGRTEDNHIELSR